MDRRIATALSAASLVLALAPVAEAHEGNPNFESRIRGLSPAVAGLRVEVVNRDDSLELTNRSTRTIVVLGYSGEPYARIRPDGTVEVNASSPARYLNEDRFGTTDVPATATARARPRWELVDRTGRFTWHDHRIHWMGKGRPPQVRDADVETEVFDWRVAFETGGRPVTLTGTLFWTPRDDGGPPAAAIAAFALLAAAGAAAVLVVRRRRRDRPAEAGDAW